MAEKEPFWARRKNPQQALSRIEFSLGLYEQYTAPMFGERTGKEKRELYPAQTHHSTQISTHIQTKKG
ncbi:MAG: hypothetical protein IPM81_18070 [Saprospirales bacterium]|nr:hypothetical protein [Saprospirales bacterium]